MAFTDRLKRCFKLRFAIVYPFAIYAVFFTHPDAQSISQGIGFVVLGLLTRLWSNGYAIKLEKLTTSGPYAHIRHPLYFGTSLVLIGFIIMLKMYLVGILFFIVVVSVYFRTIKQEEQMLEDKFKDDYLDYKKKVPAFYPAVLAYSKGEKWPFSFERLMRSKEYKSAIWVIIFIIFIYLKTILLVQKLPMNNRLWALAAIAVLLAATDITGEIIKKGKR
ncbi:MAG: isoprenylcysteine carboxylmethyltransferase family protein [Candidatus Omnitrophica bacterium]|nr:isoprenylcysteine carboxylmethyltransferase family protein [Candidatus Omnitrophota bacterium]